MQPSTQSPPSSSPSFRGLLASLASPANSASPGGSAWSDGGLEDDVVTLSYERALSALARSKPADRGEEPVTETAGAGAQPEIAAKPITSSIFDESATVSARAAAHKPAEFERRAASVTIRLSRAERARLRLRAAEAGLTVSAYLRSCVLEADALRAQVKQALAEMRIARSNEQPPANTPARSSWFGWLMRLFSRRSSLSPSVP
jgi:predicted DNA binding CopG/RHH family protein